MVGAHPVNDDTAAEGLADEDDGRAGGDARVVHLPLDGVGDDAEVGIEGALGTDGAPHLTVIAAALGDDDDAAQAAELRLEGAVSRQHASSSGAADEDRLGTVGGGGVGGCSRGALGLLAAATAAKEAVKRTL